MEEYDDSRHFTIDAEAANAYLRELYRFGKKHQVQEMIIERIVLICRAGINGEAFQRAQAAGYERGENEWCGGCYDVLFDWLYRECPFYLHLNCDDHKEWVLCCWHDPDKDEKIKHELEDEDDDQKEVARLRKKFQEFESQDADEEEEIGKAHLKIGEFPRGRAISNKVIEIANDAGIEVADFYSDRSRIYRGKPPDIEPILNYAAGDDSVVFVEAKLKLTAQHLEDFVTKMLAHIPGNYNIYGAVVFAIANKRTLVLAEKLGLFALKVGLPPHNLRLLNREGFKPTAYSSPK